MRRPGNLSGLVESELIMRWTLIASGFLFTAVLRFAFGHSEPRPQPSAPAPVADFRSAEAPPAPPPPSPAAPANGASLLSLIEVGPAEVEVSPPVAAPAKPKAVLTASAVDPPPRPGLDDAARRALRRQDRQSLWAVSRTLHEALASCGQQQLRRDPRHQGNIEVEVLVVPLAGTERALVKSVLFESQNLFAPLFEGCVRNALSAAVLPRPGTQLDLSTNYHLTPEVDHTAADEDDDADSDEPDAATEDSRK